GEGVLATCRRRPSIKWRVPAGGRAADDFLERFQRKLPRDRWAAARYRHVLTRRHETEHLDPERPDAVREVCQTIAALLIGDGDNLLGGARRRHRSARHRQAPEQDSSKLVAGGLACEPAHPCEGGAEEKPV